MREGKVVGGSNLAMVDLCRAIPAFTDLRALLSDIGGRKLVVFIRKI